MHIAWSIPTHRQRHLPSEQGSKHFGLRPGPIRGRDHGRHGVKTSLTHEGLQAFAGRLDRIEVHQGLSPEKVDDVNLSILVNDSIKDLANLVGSHKPLRRLVMTQIGIAVGTGEVAGVTDIQGQPVETRPIARSNVRSHDRKKVLLESLRGRRGAYSACTELICHLLTEILQTLGT
jgi:hypothetical protein